MTSGGERGPIAEQGKSPAGTDPTDTDPTDTNHRTGDDQADENVENEPPA